MKVNLQIKKGHTDGRAVLRLVHSDPFSKLARENLELRQQASDLMREVRRLRAQDRTSKTRSSKHAGRH